MKKRISVLLTIIMLFGLWVMPASAYTEIDYSCYEGKWDWDQGGSWIEINSCTDTAMNFNFVYGQFAVTVTNAQVDGTNVYGEYYEVWDDGVNWFNYVLSGNFHMSLGDSGIWVDWTSSEDGSAPSTRGMMFNKKGFVPRYIEHTNIPVLLNGMPVEFDQPPVMCQDRVFVPMRKIFELMNADVYYDTGFYKENDGSMTGQRITAVKNSASTNHKIILDEYHGKWTMWELGTSSAPVEQYGRKVELYAQPLVLSGRTLLPIRAISNGFGALAEWDVENSRVIITGDITGQRKSAEVVSKIQSFTYEAAKKIVLQKCYFKKGFFTPEYDGNGKFYRFLVSDDGTKDGKDITIYVYNDGTIIQH